MPTRATWDPHVGQAVKIIERQFPVKGGTYVGHQPRMGLAADFMCSKAVGDQLAAWMRQHAASLGIEYIIWYRRIWNIRRDSEGWRVYTGTSNPHTDHVHGSWLPASEVGSVGGPNLGTDSEDLDTDQPFDAFGNAVDLSGISGTLAWINEPRNWYNLIMIIVGVIVIVIATYRIANVEGIASGAIGKVLS